ncbi:MULTISPECIES: TonB-dependent hemoglobin/transferrin/lactoferrin family receptor [unclassified Bartonella]|uniref:TonB-dependent hemoglobin/transferrin/lactoferrin family receptor n=1 Tax=unclassified Bartonella TaxID=2645622 RepID=UPI0009997166|nr:MULTISPECIES: TonB-dependent hemoglobin/transferrin/lactoferrin family receptor [unclassified Bartonella]AQX27682.1 hemoglobin/transferrin/lactoferrin receptor protein [Bartonella sp. JB15]AQX28963.1 hemoglobin/transferrin/lactoferrin receptor protein [Bartonella sp. JB63]
MRIKRNVYKGYVILSILSVCMPSFVFAKNKDEDSIAKLKPIVIEKKIENPLNKATVLTDRETIQNIDKKQINDIRDISHLNPSINYSTDNNSFVIRGLNANRVLTTMDGIPLPWLNDGVRGIKGGSSAFAFNVLSTIDIVRGSDSSLHGSGALGGVIALRTLNPEELLTKEKNWGALTKGSYNSVDKSWHIDQAFAVRTSQTLLLFQGSRAEGHQRKNMGTVEGYGDKRTRENPADFDKNNLLFKVHQYLNDNHRFGFTAERFAHNKDTHSLNTSTKIFLPKSVYTEKHTYRKRFSIFYDYNGNGDAIFDAFHGQLYWQKQLNNHILNGYRIQAPKGDYLRDNFISNTGYGFNAHSFKKLDIGSVSHKLKFATSVFASKFHQYASGKDNCHLRGNERACVFLGTNKSDAPDTNSHGFGLAFENEFGFSNNSIRIIPGIRYDWYKHIPQKTPAFEKALGSRIMPKENRSSHFSPKMRIEWDANNQVLFYTQWAQAFRAPSFSELYLTFVRPSFYYMIGDPNLKPETSNGYDIGVQYKNMHFSSFFSVFTNEYKNFIDVIDKGPSQEFMYARKHYINRAHVRISGVETKTYFTLMNGFYSNVALSYVQGKDLDKDEYLDSIPAFKTVFGLGYEKELWGTNVVLTLAAKRDKVKGDYDYVKVPGYGVVDILGWWKPFGEKGPVIRAGIYNLLDQKYWNATDLPSPSPIPKRQPLPPKDYFSQPGRNFKISYVQKF